MYKQILITQEAYAILLQKKAASVATTGRSPTYSEIITEVLKNDG